MSEPYTPTTGEVRRRYAYARSDKPPHKSQSAVAEFDRWLSEHDRQVAERAWDHCMDEIEKYEINTQQAREGNPYRAAKGEQRWAFSITTERFRRLADALESTLAELRQERERAEADHNREELIKRAFEAHEGAPTWDEDPIERDLAIRWHMRGFNDALAVFEQAHPVQGRKNSAQNSDDEREWLADWWWDNFDEEPPFNEHDVLEALVIAYLVPAMQARGHAVDLVRIGTIHNPVRAERLNGEDVDWYGLDHSLPIEVSVTREQILAAAGQDMNQTKNEGETDDRSA